MTETVYDKPDRNDREVINLLLSLKYWENITILEEKVLDAQEVEAELALSELALASGLWLLYAVYDNSHFPGVTHP